MLSTDERRAGKKDRTDYHAQYYCRYTWYECEYESSYIFVSSSPCFFGGEQSPSYEVHGTAERSSRAQSIMLPYCCRPHRLKVG